MYERIEDSPLFNADLAPVAPDQRTWRTHHFASLWVGLSVCIPTYMLAAGLIAGGMNWWQALMTIVLGNCIVLIPMLLNAHAGTKYGIPLPVLARASFGTLGANVPSMLRGLVACGWFGIQTWIGGEAIHSMLGILVPGWKELPAGIWISFFSFWLVNIFFIVKGTESIKHLQTFAAPFLILLGLGLLAWAHDGAGGWGPMLSQGSRFNTTAEFWRFFVPSLTGMVGFWATVALNIPDFTRYARSQRDQIMGQALGLPATMALYSFIGIAVTSATVIIYGEAVWDPVDLLGRFDNPFITLVALFGLLFATLTTNIAANVVSPANGFANIAPRHISFVTGGLITGVIGIAIMPWKLLSDFGTYIFGWLVGYSGFLGPIAGIIICDYFLIRKTRLEVTDLYLRGSRYEYTRGFNYRAIAALAAGILLALIGLIVEPLRVLYDYSWFVGFFTAFFLYIILMRRSREEVP